MIDLRFVPIDKWPQEPTRRRTKSPFAVTYKKLLDDMEREMKHLGAKSIVVQAYFSFDQLRNDGWPYSSARPSAPGVILSFTTRKGEDISFPCDTYLDFESNLRAISLTLTALRAIDRYGVTKHNEQYKGWAKLPPASDSLGVPEAAVFIQIHSGVPADLLNDRIAFERACRTAQRKLHPDNAESGNHDQFVLLGKAIDSFKQAHGWSAESAAR